MCTVLGINPYTQVKVQVKGPGVSKTPSYPASSGQQYTQQFPIHGGRAWSDEILSIGGKPPPASGSQVTSTWQCDASTSGTSTGTGATGSASSAPGCAVVQSEQSCSFTATGSTIVLAGTGKGQFVIDNQITGQGSTFQAPTTSTFTPILGDKYTVRNYSNADMTVRQQ
jgi:hypothetical protein